MNDQEPYVSPYLTNPPLTTRERAWLRALNACDEAFAAWAQTPAGTVAEAKAVVRCHIAVVRFRDLLSQAGQ